MQPNDLIMLSVKGDLVVILKKIGLLIYNIIWFFEMIFGFAISLIAQFGSWITNCAISIIQYIFIRSPWGANDLDDLSIKDIKFWPQIYRDATIFVNYFIIPFIYMNEWSVLVMAGYYQYIIFYHLLILSLQITIRSIVFFLFCLIYNPIFFRVDFVFNQLGIFGNTEGLSGVFALITCGIMIYGYQAFYLLL